MKAHALFQVKDVVQSIVRDVPGAGELRDDRTVSGKLHQPLEHIPIQNFGDGGGGIRGGIQNWRLELHADGDALGGLYAERRKKQCREQQRPQQPGGRWRAATHRFALHAVPQSSDRAASAITFAELTMSSITTYSSGWCARSRMPGP